MFSQVSMIALILLGLPVLGQENLVEKHAVENSIGQWQAYTHNPVLSPGQIGSWDAGAIGSMTMVKANNLYHMYYEAWKTLGISDKDFYTLQIGHATSPDGIHWVKDPANPVVPKGTNNDWDSSRTWDPSVIYEGGVFKIWYGGGVGVNDVGYATSADGTHFTKQGQLSHLGQVQDFHVVHDRGSGYYFIYYWNYEPHGLFCAQSSNETNFDFAGSRPIHIDGLSYRQEYKFPDVFQDNGRWFMYFGEIIRPNCLGSWTGCAVSKDGLRWKAQNPHVIQCRDAFVLKVMDNTYFMYYGPDGYYNKKNGNIRLSIHKGNLGALAQKGEK